MLLKFAWTIYKQEIVKQMCNHDSEFKSEDCVKECDYRGKFNPDKCDTGCGEPTQRW